MCVDHEILIGKMYSYDVKGVAMELVKRYLLIEHNMCQVSSSTVNVDIDVPQGSILGPIFLSIHLNDLDSIID